MVFPILARVGARAIIPFLGRITPTIGRRIILPVGRGALGLGKFVGRRFIEKPLKTTGIITTGILGAGVLAASPIARRKVTRAPKTIFEKGGVIGAGIEQIAAGEKEAGLTAIQKGLIGAGIAGTAGAAAIAGARAIKKKKAAEQQIPTPIPAAPPLPTRPSIVGRIPVTPISPDIPTEIMPTEKLIKKGIPDIRLTANPKINVVIQNSIT